MMLKDANYDKAETEGFTQGFSLQYSGDTNVSRQAPNLKFHVGNPTVLWNKIMKEVRLKRFAGPYKTVPFDNYIQSPVGLVPKDQGRDTRLIFHLSYPRIGTKSINTNTPSELCSVKNAEFDQAIKLCLMSCQENPEPIFLATSDAQSAFRVLGLDPESWHWTILKAQSPIDNQWYFFVDKCLPLEVQLAVPSSNGFLMH